MKKLAALLHPVTARLCADLPFLYCVILSDKVKLFAEDDFTTEANT